MARHSEDRLTRRNYPTELRTSDSGAENGLIEGIPIVFNSETLIRDYGGDFYEIIEPTALDKCDLKDVLLFINHDTEKIALARSKNGKGTMSLEVKEDGLHFRASLDIANNSEARNLYSAIQRGDMDGMSFMFRVKKDEWTNIESETPTRTIKEISIVHEISVVNYPAYDATTVTARSADTDSPLMEMRKKFEETKKTDKAKIDLEIYKYLTLLESKK